MSYMSEKKAQELFKQQMQAELTNDDLARELERQLNDAGWFITSGPDGTTIKRKDSPIDLSGVDMDYVPKDSYVAPYRSNDQPNSKLWRNIGIGVLIAVVTILIIWGSIRLYRKYKTSSNATS